MKTIKVFDIPKHFSYKLPNNVLNHCKIYTNIKNRKTSIYAWFCLSKLVNLEKIKFTKNGKPYFLNHSKYVSLSHSGNKIAIAVCDEPIGIDIQKIISLRIASTLSKRLLNEQQLLKYRQLKNKTLWLTKYWTKYEALIKVCNKAVLNDRVKIVTKQIDNEYVMSYAINKKRG